MVLDENMEMASNFAIPTGIGTFFPSDAAEVDPVLQSTGGEGLSPVIQITQAVTSGGAAKVAFELVSDATGTIATDGTATAHFSTGMVPIASLTAGWSVAVPLPPGPYEKFLGLLVNISGAALTGGRFNAFLTETPARWTA